MSWRKPKPVRNTTWSTTSSWKVRPEIQSTQGIYVNSKIWRQRQGSLISEIGKGNRFLLKILNSTSPWRDQLIDELIRAKAGELEAKKLRSERGWCKQEFISLRTGIWSNHLTLAATLPIKRICRALGVNRSGFYKWKHRLEHPSQKLLDFADNLQLFKRPCVNAIPRLSLAKCKNSSYDTGRLCPISMRINVAKRSAS